MLKAQLSEALQDASDAQVVVHIPAREETFVGEITNEKQYTSPTSSYMGIFEYSPLQVSKSLLPIFCSFHFTRLFVDQTDAIEAQHEFIGLDKSPLGVLILLEGLASSGGKCIKKKQMQDILTTFVVTRNSNVKNVNKHIKFNVSRVSNRFEFLAGKLLVLLFVKMCNL